MQVIISANGREFGPLGELEIEKGLAEGQFSPDDYAWQEGCADWVPLRNLLAKEAITVSSQMVPQSSFRETLDALVTDEQDPTVVSKIHGRVMEILTREETIQYIGVQKKPVVTFSPDAIVVTTRRLIFYRPSMMGVSFEDYPWREVANVHMSEQLLGATITCQTVAGTNSEVNHIPKKQARRIYSFAQEIEESMVIARRQTELERLRASAGGVVVQTANVPSPSSSHDDPIAILTKLKQMVEAGLIKEKEYDAKKAEILGRM